MTGHPDFVKLTEDEIRLHESKNADYAGGGDPLGNFKRVAAMLAPYCLDLGDPAVVALVYMMKQVDAALWLLGQGTEGAVETVDTRLRDVHVYAKLVRILREEEAQEETEARMYAESRAKMLDELDAMEAARSTLAGVPRDIAPHVETAAPMVASWCRCYECGSQAMTEEGRRAYAQRSPMYLGMLVHRVGCRFAPPSDPCPLPGTCSRDRSFGRGGSRAAERLDAGVPPAAGPFDRDTQNPLRLIE